MEQQDDIELQLWSFIDGVASGEDMQRIAYLIETDEFWRTKYDELHAFHIGCLDAIDPDQPSLRFTKNVMESIASTNVAPATSKYINPAILRGIAAFFILSIIAFFVYSFTSVNWAAPSSYELPRPNLTHLPTTHFITGTTFYVIIGFNVVIGLVLADTLLRKKMKGQH